MNKVNLLEGEVLPFTPAKKPVDALTRLRGGKVYDIMPEFQKKADLGSMDSFTKGYVDAILFTEAHSDNPELDGASIEDFAPEAISKIVHDCTKFQQVAADDLLNYGDSSYGDTQAGHDFWMTRNHHGVGFWENDHCDEETGKRLTYLAHKFGEVYVNRGDDGLIYID